MAKKKKMAKKRAQQKRKMLQEQKKNNLILRLEQEKRGLKRLKAELNTRRWNNLKAMGVRNLKVVAAAGRFIVPYILVGTLSIGGVKLLGGGYPFVTDEVKANKDFYIDYKTGENLYYETSYNTDKAYDDHLLITTPWILNEEGVYEKYEREYVINNENIEDIFNAILREDFDFILENITIKTEKRITSTNINLAPEENILYVDAHIDGVDNETYIYVDESFGKNFWASAAYLALIGIFSYFITKGRKFNVSSRMKLINDEYKKVFILNEKLVESISECKRNTISLRKELKKYGK